ncbi:MAG: LCP family protein, partial [Oscillochloris sp.]|nr:LCP family protein [Oscillochloris sp.]
LLPSIVGNAPNGPARIPTLMPTAPIIPVAGQAINILLLGSDRRPGESWTTRSDAIVVIHLDPARERVALLSLPRDLVVPIPGYGQARINAATVYGDLDPSLGGGLALARRTVSEYLGIPITYVLRADFHAFIAAVDAIGGVEIDVPEALYDPAYPTMDYGYMVASFAPGRQHMDGETALIYARMRHADSSYARNRRQQLVLLAIMNQVRSRNILAQVQVVSDLTSALRDDIQTDMSPERMLGLAWAFRGISPDTVERYALDESMVSEGVLADDPYATFADTGQVRQLVRQLVNGPTP